MDSRKKNDPNAPVDPPGVPTKSGGKLGRSPEEGVAPSTEKKINGKKK